MRIAFVVQRYGTEILGGSELHCRLIAERMAERHDVDVLTTCAVDYRTWQNEYPEGADRVRGVTVRRFAVSEERDLQAFNAYSDWIFNYPHSREDELEWVRRQGPWSPGLFEYLEKQHQQYELLIFFTYLYAPTVLGVKISPAKSILVPTAHDEPAIHLDIYRDVFAAPAGIAFNTEVERIFLTRTFDIRAVAQETVGCGVDLPPVEAREVEDPRVPQESTSKERRPQERSAAPPAPDRGRPRLEERGSAFRRRQRLFGPFALYGGRIEAGKGCEELFEYFGSYAKSGEAQLVLMGSKLMPLPEEPWVRFAGRLSDSERFHALEAATVVIVPSPYESLSLLALEAFTVGTPVLANARSEVVVEHCRTSNAGLFYADRDEFVECLKLLVADRKLREGLGRNGQQYVARNYRWDVILSKYDRLIATIRASRQRS
ncbi:MAG: glycosyltransferase family 4 protein [Vicinamibacterales bacterium]